MTVVYLYQSDLEFVEAGYYLVDPLVEKKADAAFGVFENYEMVEAKYRGLDEINLFKFTDYGVPSYGYLVFVTSERSIRDRKEIISKFLRAIRNSVKFTLNNPQESLESFLETLPVLNNELNRCMYSATLRCYRDDTSTISSDSSPSVAADMMLQHNVRHLLVVDKSSTNKPIGIITPLDFTRYQEYPNVNDKNDTIEKILEYYI